MDGDPQAGLIAAEKLFYWIWLFIMLPHFTFVLATVLGLVVSFGDVAQAQPTVAGDAQQAFLESLSFRSLGPYRGGRSAATAGVADNPMLYYMGAAGGGSLED